MSARTPRTCASRSRRTSRAALRRAGDGRGRRTASRRRCATRCWPAASASGRCSRSRPRGRAGADPARVLPLAAALELIHTYSLIHDDLPAMDDDDLRRGRPTCHKAFGENVAILAGDGLYAEAFRHVLTRQQGDPQAILAAVGELAAATGVNGMVGGQYLDVTERAPAGADGLRTLHALKTGKLIAASILCPLRLVCVGEPARIELFRDFASELGVLFQIVDDILDVTGSDDRARQDARQRRAARQAHVRERVRARARARAGGRVAPQRARRARAGGARRRARAGADHRLHRHPHLMSDRPPTSDPPPHRAPAGPPRPRRRRADAARAGGARAHHRHGRGDRRPLRREPRHVRAGRRAALAARLAARQDPVGRRPPGLSAQGAHRPPRPAARRSASTAG